MSEKTVYLVSPRGFCAGVRGALEIFKEARRNCPGQIYVLNELVHNRRVREEMIAAGAVFTSSLEEVPNGVPLLFGAHGVGKEEIRRAQEKDLQIIDACCPRVKRLHREAAAVSEEKALILFGNPVHPEVRGVAGHAGTPQLYIVNSAEEIPSLPEKLPEPILLCQTTRDHLEIAEFSRRLKEKYPDLKTGGGVCNAVYLRQQAVERLTPYVDAMIIAGSSHSSNANRMCDVAHRLGKEAFLVDTAAALPDLSPYRRLGLGAGASTPDETVMELLRYLKNLGYREKPKPEGLDEASQVADR